MTSGVKTAGPRGQGFEYPSRFTVFLLRSFALVTSTLFWSITFHGLENIPDPRNGGILVVSNHPTYFDPAWISIKLTRFKLRYMAWDEAFNWRFVGPMIRHLGAFPVKLRSGPAKSTIVEALRSLRDGAALVIFPEGEREFADGKLHEFKTGAVHIGLNAAVPVLPVTVRGGSSVWPQGQKYPSFFRHVEVIYHPILNFHEKPEDVDLDTYLDSLNSKLRDRIESAL